MLLLFCEKLSSHCPFHVSPPELFTLALFTLSHHVQVSSSPTAKTRGCHSLDLKSVTKATLPAAPSRLAVTRATRCMAAARSSAWRASGGHGIAACRPASVRFPASACDSHRFLLLPAVLLMHSWKDATLPYTVIQQLRSVPVEF